MAFVGASGGAAGGGGSAAVPRVRIPDDELRRFGVMIPDALFRHLVEQAHEHRGKQSALVYFPEPYDDMYEGDVLEDPWEIEKFLEFELSVRTVVSKLSGVPLNGINLVLIKPFMGGLEEDYDVKVSPHFEEIVHMKMRELTTR